MINNPILSLATIFILGFFLSRVAKRLKIPTITTYVALGIIVSPGLLNLLSRELLSASEVFSHIVLGIIAFSLGEAFSLDTLRRVGRSVCTISISASVIPWLVVALGLFFILREPFSLALVFGAIAAATAPAAVVMVTQEYRSKGEFTDTLLGVVAIDDAWALIIFGLSLSVAKSFVAGMNSVSGVFFDLVKALLEIGGSFVVGGLVAIVFNKLSHFITTVKDRLIYTLGFLFLAIGLSLAFNFSVLLSCMFFGALLVNTNRMSFHFFESLREIDTPLYLIFFVLAGAELRINVLGGSLLLVVAFIVLRSVGKLLGASLGARLGRCSSVVRKYMGLALIPQAGVALACALVAKHTLNNSLGDKILTVTVAATLIFELLGPSLTRFSLARAGEIKE